MMELFDAHCHLQDERVVSDVDGLLARAATAGVTQAVICGTSAADWARVTALCGRFFELTPAYGVHPWFVAEQPSDWFSRLAAALGAHTAAGVGEIGLDHAVKPRNDSEQLDVFDRQVALAIELGRPISIHCRRAWGPLLETLRRRGPFPSGFVVHAYSGARECVAELVALGGYVSFSGSLTYPRNRRGRAAALAVPADRLLIETDSPDMLPYGIADVGATGAASAGTRPLNEPANLVRVLGALAELRGTAVADVAELTRSNAQRLFHRRD